MKRTYTYELEKVNMVNGRPKGDEVQVYESSTRLKVDNVYFHLPGLDTGGFHVLRELRNETQ